MTRFARAAHLPYRGLHAARRNQAGDSLDGLFRPYSHSIINEPSKLLICKALAASSQTFAVTFTVNLAGISIGAGFRAVLRKRTFRDLSRSIDSRDHRRRHQRASESVQESPQGA